MGRFANRTTSGAWERWRQFVAERVYQRDVAARALAFFTGAASAKAWLTWIDFVAGVRAVRAAVAAFACRATRASWNRWRDLVVERIDARQCAGRALTFFTNRTLAASWNR